MTTPATTVPLDRIAVLGDRILVQLYEPDHCSAGGIILPDTSQKQRGIAKVIQLGPDALDKGVHVGDDVNCSRYSFESYPVSEFGERMRIITLKDVQAVIKPETQA